MAAAARAASMSDLPTLDIGSYLEQARDIGKRDGVLEAARWLRLQGKPEEALALVIHIDEVCQRENTDATN